MQGPRRSTGGAEHRLAFACCVAIVGLALAGCGDDADLLSDAPTTTVTIAGPTTTDAPTASSGTADRNNSAQRGGKTEQAEKDRGKAETDRGNKGDRSRGESRGDADTDPGSQGGSGDRESRDRGADRSLDEEEQGAIVGGRRDGEPIPASPDSDQVSRPEAHGPDYWELYQQEHSEDGGRPDS